MPFFSRARNALRFAGYSAYARAFSVKGIYHKGVKFRLHITTANEVHRGFTFSAKEPETLTWIDSFPEDSIVYDIGANVGVYSLYAAKRHPNVKVYAFEPDNQSFAALCRNIRLNRLNGNVTPYQFALAKDSHVGILNVSRPEAGAGAAALGGAYQFVHARPSDIFRQGVAAFSLDDLVGKYGFLQPNVIKVDVDGLEEEIIAGAEAVLASDALRGMLVEFQYRQESDLARTFNRLKAFGFELRRRSDWVSVFEGVQSRNFIFARWR